MAPASEVAEKNYFCPLLIWGWLREKEEGSRGERGEEEEEGGKGRRERKDREEEGGVEGRET